MKFASSEWELRRGLFPGFPHRDRTELGNGTGQEKTSKVKNQTDFEFYLILQRWCALCFKFSLICTSDRKWFKWMSFEWGAWEQWQEGKFGTQTPARACSLTKFPPSHTHVYLLLVALGTRFVLLWGCFGHFFATVATVLKYSPWVGFISTQDRFLLAKIMLSKRSSVLVEHKR